MGFHFHRTKSSKVQNNLTQGMAAWLSVFETFLPFSPENRTQHPRGSACPIPSPAYATLSLLIRILEKKKD